MSKITKKQLLKRLEVLEEWSNWADNMLDELNHALPDPEYDAKCEADAVDIDASLARHHARLGLTQPKLKVLDQSVFDGLDEEWRFAAVVEDGRALYFNKRPCGSDDITGNFVFKGDYQASFCGNDYDASNWQNSLIERESLACEESDFLNDTISNIVDEIIDSEYFYSKITCELLEKGCSYVLAYVSDTSEQNAIENKEVAVIESVDVLINDTSGGDWKYAVPINQQTGEPLTAKEAGF